jgi:hypothetical protein
VSLGRASWMHGRVQRIPKGERYTARKQPPKKLDAANCLVSCAAEPLSPTTRHDRSQTHVTLNIEADVLLVVWLMLDGYHHARLLKLHWESRSF